MDKLSQKPLHQDPLVGTKILDKYLVLSVLGEGGWGVVYKAKHETLDRLVAIKTMHAHFARDPQKIKRFEQEARAASTLRNEYVAQVYDFGVLSTGQPYFVMDFVAGSTLNAMIREGETLAQDRALAIFRMICQGLHAAHSAGIIHRDIKPSNIFIVQDSAHGESVRLIDFGLAKLVTPDGNAADNLTHTGETIGTPQYMSPEQCTGRSLDARSDIYSLGCVMYEVLTGTVAFNGESAFECMSMHVAELPKSFRLVCKENINPAVEAIVMRCLEKKPEDRYQAVDQLLHDLNVLPKPKPFSKLRQLRKPGLTALLAAALIGIAVFGFATTNVKKAPVPATITKPSVVIPHKPIEQHFAIDPAQIQIVNSGNDVCWLASKGKQFLCLPDAKSARSARDVLRYYGANELVTIGQPESGTSEETYEMVYFLTPHGPPKGPMKGEDNTGAFSAKNVKAEVLYRAWKVTNGDEFMMDFGEDEAAAQLAAATIKKYNFRYMCFFANAEDDRIMPYFRI